MSDRGLRFVKMHGIGNDYVYLDGVSDPTVAARIDAEPVAWRALVVRMSDRHEGIGSDGAIVLCQPRKVGAAVRMRMFNADGSESAMCGNGIRCVAKFAHDRLGVVFNPMLIETGRGVLSVSYLVGAGDGRLATATVDMGEPILDAARIPTTLPGPRVVGRELPPVGNMASRLAEQGVEPRLTCVSMGNPHAVLFCDDPARVDLPWAAAALRALGLFPEDANYHFAAVADPARVSVRTWERGTGPTRACGTGACAVLVSGVLTGRLDRDATVRLPGGELHIRWDAESGHVFMTGPATESFEGVWSGTFEA